MKQPTTCYKCPSKAPKPKNSFPCKTQKYSVQKSNLILAQTN
jgi:hypothetical protein